MSHQALQSRMVMFFISDTHDIASVVAHHQGVSFSHRMPHGKCSIIETEDTATFIKPRDIMVGDDRICLTMLHPDDEFDYNFNLTYESIIHVNFTEYDHAMSFLVDITRYDKDHSVEANSECYHFEFDSIGKIDIPNVNKAVLLSNGTWVVLSYDEEKDLHAVSIVVNNG